MIIPQRALVRPRVTTPDGEGPSLLEDEVRDLLEARSHGFIELVGPSGAGASTALSHLAWQFDGEARLELADRPNAEQTEQLLRASDNEIVICAAPDRDRRLSLERIIQRWRLAAWTEEDCIEYLLAEHRDKCASVMSRLRADQTHASLEGLPLLLRGVLDRFAADESLVSVDSALRQVVEAALAAPELISLARLLCFVALTQLDWRSWVRRRFGEISKASVVAIRLLAQNAVNQLLAADHLAAHLRTPGPWSLLEKRMPEPLVREIARIIRDDESILDGLRLLLSTHQHSRQPMAASILHAAAGQWRPANGRAPYLAGAYLKDSRWPGVRLARLDIGHADLRGADLTEARLNSATARSAQLAGARLHGAQLKRFTAVKANFVGADLSFVRASWADFQLAKLNHANLEGALLTHAVFAGADMSAARACRANFANANLTGATLDEADFSGADFSAASLRQLDWTTTELAGTCFAHALADGCNFEGVQLPGASFRHACLNGAVFTGSRMPGANFSDSQLTETRLADVEWEGADLRGADLRWATFHMGSSRSGLVDSTIASEGTRTGFYTDEYTEQGFKAPEEIRKANLCNADLRGALIDRVDFYLVDLRGALYSPEQEAHFRACRAILEARV